MEKVENKIITMSWEEHFQNNVPSQQLARLITTFLTRNLVAKSDGREEAIGEADKLNSDDDMPRFAANVADVR